MEGSKEGPKERAVRLPKSEKRALKAAALKERRARRRQHEKAAHKEQVAQRRAARDAEFTAMTPEEQEAFRLADRQSREARYHEVCAQNARVAEALATGMRVVIDLSYGDIMDIKEQKSLARQLSRCWGSNRRAAAPLPAGAGARLARAALDRSGGAG